MMKEEQNTITHDVIGSAMEVHQILGNGFQEVVCQRALSVELKLRGMAHHREFETPIYYKGEDVGGRRVDFLVCGEISVEIKAIVNLDDVHLAQAMNYLEAYNLQTGLLINFGSKSLQFKRLFNKNTNRKILAIMKILIKSWFRQFFMAIRTKNAFCIQKNCIFASSNRILYE